MKYTENFATVGDLKKVLEALSDTLPLGVSGHFGEFKPFTKCSISNLSVRNAYLNIKDGKPTGMWRSYSGDKRVNVDFVELPSIDIGEEPD